MAAPRFQGCAMTRASRVYVRRISDVLSVAVGERVGLVGCDSDR